MTPPEIDLFRMAVDYVESADYKSAHLITVQLEGYPIVDMLHSILHRRCGEYSDSAYWIHQVGNDMPPQLTKLYGNPLTFVDTCERALPNTPEAKLIEAVEAQELTIIRSLLPRTGKKS